jgi:hypothetical protein
MKKNLLILFTFLASGILTAQVNLENIYYYSGAVAEMEVYGSKYYAMDVVNEQCKIYDENHNLWKAINLYVPDGQYLYDIQYVSTHLFNTDDLVELIYTYYLYDETGEYYTYETRIVNENGTELLKVPGASYFYISKFQNNDYKLLIYVWDYSVYPYTVETHIYDIPGTLSTSYQETQASGFMPAYPNPASNDIHIPVITNNDSENNEIHILNIQGSLLKKIRVERGAKEVSIKRGSLSAGTYICRQMSDGEHTATQKLIIK